ncbi:MAG: ketol-acid reductoisomerase [Gammaproteobacteria bacterium]
MQTYYDKDTDPALLRGRRVAIFGFGSQGRAHALNLRDSAIDVCVALRENSASRAGCEADDLRVCSLEHAAERCDLLMMLVPDEAQVQLYQQVLAPRMQPGAALMFAHGYNIHFGRLQPRADLDVLMVAPLGIGEQVRATYTAGGGTPALLAVHQDASGSARALGLSYAAANGHGRAGIIETSFRNETETDLFAEQAVLCGGITHLIGAAFDTLVEAGYPEELAYFSCLHEVKLIADMIHRQGIADMRRSISSTAEYGDYTRGPRVINQASRDEMRRMLDEIRDGRFADELDADAKAGFPTLLAGREAAESHGMEAVGARLRAMMPWLK